MLLNLLPCRNCIYWVSECTVTASYAHACKEVGEHQLHSTAAWISTLCRLALSDHIFLHVSDCVRVFCSSFRHKEKLIYRNTWALLLLGGWQQLSWTSVLQFFLRWWRLLFIPRNYLFTSATELQLCCYTPGVLCSYLHNPSLTHLLNEPWFEHWAPCSSPPPPTRSWMEVFISPILLVLLEVTHSEELPQGWFWSLHHLFFCHCFPCKFAVFLGSPSWIDSPRFANRSVIALGEGCYSRGQKTFLCFKWRNIKLTRLHPLGKWHACLFY